MKATNGPIDISAEADAPRLSELEERIARGEDVVTLGMLRSMILISGQTVTVEDMRRMLRIAEPKPGLKGYLIRALICAALAVFLFDAASGEDFWVAVIAIGAVIWMAYSIGLSNGGKLNPKPLDMLGRTP